MGRFAFFLMAAFCLFTGRAQTFTDDFNDNSFDVTKWGAAVNTGNGRLFEQNQRVDLVVTSPTANSDSSLRPWIGQLPVSTNWEATLQVHNNFNASGATVKRVSFGLQLNRPGNTNEFVFVELFAQTTTASGTGRGILTSLETPTTVYGDSIFEDAALTDAFVKMSYDAASGILTTSYDRDAAGTVYGWQPLATFALTGAGGGGVANRDWGLSDSQKFTLQIIGFAQVSSVTSGAVWADNFKLTIFPPTPTPTIVNVADNFNDNAVDATKWGSDTTVGNGRLFEQSQRLDYRVTSPVGQFDEAVRRWVGQLPVDADWEATVDVHNSFAPANGQWASVGVQLIRPGSTTEKIFLEVYADGTPEGIYNGFFTSLQNDPSFFGDNFYSTADVITDASLKLAYTAATKIVVVSYDRDGTASGFGWQPLGSFGLAGSGGGLASRDWGLSTSQKFTLGLYGYSTLATIGAGAVYLDNFSLNIIQSSQPQLSAVRQGTNLKLSWPATATGYTLQMKNNLNTAIWTNQTTPTIPNGANFEVLVPFTAQNQFFRLQKL